MELPVIFLGDVAESFAMEEDPFHSIYGSLWMFVDLYGCLWIFMDVCGSLWMFMDIYGCFWIFMAVCGLHIHIITHQILLDPLAKM